MSMDVGELTASVPGAAITRGVGKFSTARGTGTTGAGGRSALEAASAIADESSRTGSVSSSSVDTSSGATGCTVNWFGVTDALKNCSDASTGFDLVLNRGKPTTTRPRIKTRLARVNHPTREVRLGIK